jgi:hypothetical protein
MEIVDKDAGECSKDKIFSILMGFLGEPGSESGIVTK